ncbi:hypothetical protein bcere0028_27380 [Bacillus cereus AH1271]|nr:hypothetical protein bcere0028_27380 [Bacillus cereus AH1271]
MKGSSFLLWRWDTKKSRFPVELRNRLFYFVKRKQSLA